MKRLFAAMLALLLLATVALFPAAAEETEDMGIGVIDYTVPKEDWPAFSALFGSASDLQTAQDLLQAITVNEANGPALTVAGMLYPAQNDGVFQHLTEPQPGPMLYPVYSADSASNWENNNKDFFLLNENMEQVTETRQAAYVSDYYAKGPEGSFFIGLSAPVMHVSDSEGMVHYEDQDYTPDGTLISYKDAPKRAKLGEVRYRGNLCVVNNSVLAHWNSETHEIGDLIASSVIPVFFDDEGNAWGAEGAESYPTLFRCSQSGVKTQLGTGKQYGDREAVALKYLSSLKKETGLYPIHDADGLYGYQDGKGNWVIEPQFEYAFPFSGKFAIVTLDETKIQGIIDRNGQLLENSRGYVTFMPGYGYLINHLRMTEGLYYEQNGSTVLNLDGNPWLTTELQLGYSDGTELYIYGLGEGNDSASINLEENTLSFTTGLAGRYGDLLLTYRALATASDQQVVAYTAQEEWPLFGEIPAIVTHHRFGEPSGTRRNPNGTDHGIDYLALYNQSGDKIAADVFEAKRVGNLIWIERDGDRGYIDQDGNWLYRETRESGMSYNDVAMTDWFYEPVKFVWDEGLLGGFRLWRFEPNQNLSRMDLVTMLYRVAGSPAVQTPEEPLFEDVWGNDAPVIWANSKAIVEGYGDGTFGPEDEITREQAVAILHRFAKTQAIDSGKTAALSDFGDAQKVSDYAKSSMSWAVAEGVISGKPGPMLDPQGHITRAEISAMLFRFCAQHSLV